MQNNGRKTSILAAILKPLIIIGMVLVVLTQKQWIVDQVKLYRYQAPPEISAIADTTTMTSKARHDFYVNHPQIQGRQEFNQSCPNNGGEQTIILGCYKPLQNGIYVYTVTDPQLKGVQEVTAAHEMLHAAYDRLSKRERQRVDGLLQDYYSNGMHDERLTQVFASYKKSEPDDLVNEMHSIFATEVAVLPPALEEYYKQYFTNRQAVTNFASQYRAAFTTRQNQIKDYDSQLKTLKVEIDTAEANLAARSTELTARRQELATSPSSGNVAAYNNQVDKFNSLVSQYNALLSQVKVKISTYNALIQKRNDVSVEAQNLSQELNSRLQTQNTQ